MQVGTETLVLGISSSVVAVTAIIASAITTKVTLRHQDELARHARLWEKRVELYVDLLDALSVNDDDLGERLRKLTGSTYAFASDEVGEQATAMQVSAWTMPSGDEEAHYERGERLGIQMDSLMSMIREEIRTGREYPPSPPKPRPERLPCLKKRRARREHAADEAGLNDLRARLLAARARRRADRRG